jgi:hypothetical protein
MWQNVGAGGWPTLAVIGIPKMFPIINKKGPFGNLVAMYLGSTRISEMEELVDSMLTFYSDFNENPIVLSPLKSQSDSKSLKTPSDIVTDGERIFIADSGNNRVLVCDMNWNVIHCVGSFEGKRGFQDGDFETTRFNFPIGTSVSSFSLIAKGWHM